jgi:hypothetical protein
MWIFSRKINPSSECHTPPRIWALEGDASERLEYMIPSRSDGHCLSRPRTAETEVLVVASCFQKLIQKVNGDKSMLVSELYGDI